MIGKLLISELQGACKTGLSCLHTAFALQEAIATSLEAGKNGFVAFYDVAKAFDSVWIDGLFRQVYSSGITGKTWRAPIVYADDLASGSVNEYKLNQLMRIVYGHGCTWRYVFNARKSGVLIYSQDQTHNRRYAPLREFRLGESIVSERMNYDHVGIQTSVNINDISRIEVRISKARKTLNAATGLGIRRNGLTIATCNIIFWSLVVPTALFGCESGI